MTYIDFGKPILPIWATPAEFDKGKRIMILGFREMDGRKGETTSRYLNDRGTTYRLTFYDIEQGKERYLENHSEWFRNDLSLYRIEKNEIGILKREKIPNRKAYKWSWIKEIPQPNAVTIRNNDDELPKLTPEDIEEIKRSGEENEINPEDLPL